MHVIGTAGHVDHGKSTLVEALTGINPDRLAEEQTRGLTIELGFAWLALGSGREVSIVDVPGHVRFVRHMLAGTGSIDVALLVVAADEGVMPQTREHLDILHLLDVQNGVVVITKCDLVDEDWTDLVEEEINALLAPTSLAGAPVVRASAVSGRGLDDLRNLLDRVLDKTPNPRDIGRPRLGIDRVFTMSGFGTVVTGTLLDGHLNTGDNVEVVPGGPTARIRGLQTHRSQRDQADPGTRVAVNLVGVSTEQLRRGQVLANPDSIPPTYSLDARIRLVGQRPLRHNLRITLHVGSDEVQGRIRVLGERTGENDEIPVGSEGWCQLILQRPVAVLAGDLFVLRVSDQTIAGGRIIEVNPPRHRRTDPATIKRLEARAEGTVESRVFAELERLGICSLSEISAELEIEDETIRLALEGLTASSTVYALAVAVDHTSSETDIYVTTGSLERIGQQANRSLERYERERPLRFSMPREDLRSQLGLSQREFGALLNALTLSPYRSLEVRNDGVARVGWDPTLTAAQRRTITETLAELSEGGVAPKRLNIDPEILSYLQGAGEAVNCGDGVVMTVQDFERAQGIVSDMLRREGTATLAELRDILGTNRRVAQALLETLDRRGVTRRDGDSRLLGEEWE